MQLEAGRTAAVTRASYILLIAVFILAPLFVVVAVSLNRVAFTAFPPRGLSLRWYQAVLTDPQWRASLTVSLWIAAAVSLLAASVGTLGAIGLHRARFSGRDALVAGFLSPIVLPGLITGLALLFFFARLRWTGTNFALVLGHAVITFPYVLRVVLGSLVRETASLEEAAMTLGADELTTFRRITLPLARPGILAGTIFAFIISFDNITISLFLTAPRTVTLPIRILEHVQWAGTPAVAAISSLFLFLTVALALVVERAVGLHRVVGEGTVGFG